MKTSKYRGSCNSINDPYAKLCIPDIVKNLNVTAFNLMSRTNETRRIEWHELCKCKCILDAGACNNKQRWSKLKCRCECKESIDKGVCDEGFIWNPSNRECDCNNSCDLGEYLDYENCKRRKRLVNKLVQECTKNSEEVKLAKITLSEDENKHKCSSCTIYNVLFSIIFTISIGIGTYFVYCQYINRNKETASKYDYVHQTTSY